MTPCQTMPEIGEPSDQWRARILARPDMLTIQQFGERFGIPRALLDKRRCAGKLLSLRARSVRRYVYPAWQGRMLVEAASRARFEWVLAQFGAQRGWDCYRFFTTPSALLQGKSPIEAWLTSSNQAIECALEHWMLSPCADKLRDFPAL